VVASRATGVRVKRGVSVKRCAQDRSREVVKTLAEPALDDGPDFLLTLAVFAATGRRPPQAGG